LLYKAGLCKTRGRLSRTFIREMPIFCTSGAIIGFLERAFGFIMRQDEIAQNVLAKFAHVCLF